MWSQLLVNIRCQFYKAQHPSVPEMKRQSINIQMRFTFWAHREKTERHRFWFNLCDSRLIFWLAKRVLDRCFVHFHIYSILLYLPNQEGREEKQNLQHFVLLKISLRIKTVAIRQLHAITMYYAYYDTTTQQIHSYQWWERTDVVQGVCTEQGGMDLLYSRFQHKISDNINKSRPKAYLMVSNSLTLES